ncbi:MAG: insulinase family protein, partial [Lachnospiraceae bacterium]|nr:insulinase family protein [Lachnospiraceae bacterium]
AALVCCSPALASEGEMLPAIGDVVENFEVKDIRPYEALEAQVVLFEHQSTGAQLMYIANDDTNRTFDLTFRTHAIDDTGLPHVFEHATLDGSEKYPSKALFFNLIYQTYNTYMNASTYDRMTTFPIASLSEAQLLKYADYYTDSCLHPTILEDESIFREEAWRYRMDSEDQPLTIEGTVYSEMLGAMDLQNQAIYNFMTDAFPGSWIRYVSGGNPDVIPEMTYESLKAFHDRFYHPSNCLAYIYGEFEDYTAFLKLLDEAFSVYEKREFTTTDEEYVP